MKEVAGSKAEELRVEGQKGGNNEHRTPKAERRTLMSEIRGQPTSHVTASHGGERPRGGNGREAPPSTLYKRRAGSDKVRNIIDHEHEQEQEAQNMRGG
jgi:hypothetical protein